MVGALYQTQKKNSFSIYSSSPSLSIQRSRWADKIYNGFPLKSSQKMQRNCAVQLFHVKTGKIQKGFISRCQAFAHLNTHYILISKVSHKLVLFIITQDSEFQLIQDQGTLMIKITFASHRN